MEPNDMILEIGADDEFTFSCNKSVACFNECCRDLNQFLTPYDIIRLKNHFGMPSGEFLNTYTVSHTGPETGLPVITFKTLGGDSLICPFVTEDGCSVYENRPASCRSYPIARLAARSRETGRVTEHFVLINEPHCFGCEGGKTQTVKEWMDDQGILPYNEMNDLMMELIGLKANKIKGPLDLRTGHIFYTSLYDIDAFRGQVFEKGLLDNMNVPAGILEEAKKDDAMLYKLAIAFVKFAVFDMPFQI